MEHLPLAIRLLTEWLKDTSVLRNASEIARGPTTRLALHDGSKYFGSIALRTMRKE